MQAKQLVVRAIRFSPIILLVLLLCFIAIMDASVLSLNSLFQVLIQSAPIMLLALPVMVWLISGNMDMSAAFGTAFYVVVFGRVLSETNNLPLAIVVTWLVACVVGLFNGIFVGIFSIPSFIVTLASMSILQGMILVLSSSHAIMIEHPVMRTLGAGNIGGIPYLLIYTAAIVIIVHVVMTYTRFGANVYAMGSNIHAAQVSGVNIPFMQIKIFIFSAFFTSLASIALAARVSLVSPNLGGTSFLMNAVTACIIGGTASTGGKGYVLGTIVGALIIGTINFTMTALRVSTNMVSVVQGLIIIVALTVDTLLNRVRIQLERQSMG